jgi:hypothetical protein
MPIANCFVRDDGSTALDPEAVIRAWVAASGIETDEMTVNVSAVEQGGKAYAVMAWLYLPSLWSGDDVIALSEGLASALASGAEVESSAVQVITTTVESGAVVESGEIMRW